VITESLRLPGGDAQTSELYDNIDMYRRRARQIRWVEEECRLRVEEGSSNPRVSEFILPARTSYAASEHEHSSLELSVDRLAKACFGLV
jgi:hypothetical protein